MYAKRQPISRAINRLFRKTARSVEDMEQFLLRRYVWPLVLQDALTHDSYCCEILRPSRPFPSQRRGRTEFVGMVATADDDDDGSDEKAATCPQSCRPQAHPDWIYC